VVPHTDSICDAVEAFALNPYLAGTEIEAMPVEDEDVQPTNLLELLMPDDIPEDMTESRAQAAFRSVEEEFSQDEADEGISQDEAEEGISQDEAEEGISQDEAEEEISQDEDEEMTETDDHQEDDVMEDVAGTSEEFSEFAGFSSEGTPATH
jgi:hypothetical protein